MDNSKYFLAKTTLDEIVENGVVVDINNVARWVQESMAEDPGSVEKWISCSLPPFDIALFKYHMISKGVSTHWHDKTLASYIGIVVNTIQIDQNMENAMSELLSKNGEVLEEDAKYIMQCEFLISHREDLKYNEHIGGAFILLDSNGFSLEHIRYTINEEYQKYLIHTIMETNPDVVQTKKEWEESSRLFLADRMVMHINIIMVAISLFHCRNIEIVDKPITRAQRRRSERTGKPLITEKVLVIEPFKKKMRFENIGAHSDLRKAMHICRGHFAEYTAENPLFGKHVGRFWKPQHIRGSKGVGQVKKSYDISVDQ